MGVRWTVYKQGAGGAVKGLSFRAHRRLGRGMLPTFLIYQVTTACNSRCRMCGIWKVKPENELTLREFEHLLADPFMSKTRWVNLTGGEPFVRKDLVHLVKALKDRCPELALVAIPTNGFLTRKVVDTVQEILDLPGRKILVNVNVSIDAVGEKHDEIRRTPGGYKKAMATLDELMKVQLADGHFETGTETVVMDHNIQDIRTIYSTLKEHTPHVNLTPAILSPYYNPGEDDCGKMSEQTVHQFVKFLMELRLKEPAYAYYYTRVSEILTGPHLRKRTFPCLGGYKTMYLDARGNVYPCLMLPIPRFSFGNVRDAPVHELWFGAGARDLRRRLKGHLFCVRCTNNCDILNNLKEETIDPALFLMAHPELRKALYKSLDEGKMRKYL
ncbi:MAG: radical SAM protein [Euryarchaeota archaeon]|nr:radical SAM protein [Euryarchaeota archaeon]